MTKRRERAKAQNTMNKQLQTAAPVETPTARPAATTKECAENFYHKMSDLAIDMAKLVFGGGIIAGFFEDVDNQAQFKLSA
jgi:hypothetical protein